MPALHVFIYSDCPGSPKRHARRHRELNPGSNPVAASTASASINSPSWSASPIGVTSTMRLSVRHDNIVERKMCRHRFADEAIECRQKPRHRLYQFHLGAEDSKRLGHLKTNVAAADNGDPAKRWAIARAAGQRPGKNAT